MNPTMKLVLGILAAALAMLLLTFAIPRGGWTSRRAISCVPYHRRDLGDLRLALREAEIERVLSPFS
jgi:hypothetical protein